MKVPLPSVSPETFAFTPDLEFPLHQAQLWGGVGMNSALGVMIAHVTEDAHYQASHMLVGG